METRTCHHNVRSKGLLVPALSPINCAGRPQTPSRGAMAPVPPQYIIILASMDGAVGRLSRCSASAWTDRPRIDDTHLRTLEIPYVASDQNSGSLEQQMAAIWQSAVDSPMGRPAWRRPAAILAYARAAALSNGRIRSPNPTSSHRIMAVSSFFRRPAGAMATP